ncbi:hypothetical protein AHF37_08197 [Paragonimus kellicotti]|nr:hypothetical protein AHF37_08197 [Paragonimus kellicotti]
MIRDFILHVTIACYPCRLSQIQNRFRNHLAYLASHRHLDVLHDVSKSPKTVQQFIHSMPPSTSMQMSSNGEDPGFPWPTPRISGTRADSFPMSDCSHMLLNEENALLALNSMPALVPSTNKAERVTIGDTSKLCSQQTDRELLTSEPSPHAMSIPHYVCADSAKVSEKSASASAAGLHIVNSESPADALHWLAKKTDFILSSVVRSIAGTRVTCRFPFLRSVLSLAI